LEHPSEPVQIAAPETLYITAPYVCVRGVGCSGRITEQVIPPWHDLTFVAVFASKMSIQYGATSRFESAVRVTAVPVGTDIAVDTNIFGRLFATSVITKGETVDVVEVLVEVVVPSHVTLT
jgi:hypothetical protein